MGGCALYKMKRIYDIGENVGNFTEENLKKYSQCEFILIEANPELIPILKNKFKNLNKVKILNYCISENDGYANFYISAAHKISTASTKWITDSRFSNYKFKDPIKIQSSSLNSIVEKYGKSDYIKIDVEGYEKTIILGIKKYLGLISFEWAEELKSDILDCITHLNSIGYTNFFVNYNDNYTFLPSEYYNFEKIKDEINKLNPKNKEKWGMIFAH